MGRKQSKSPKRQGKGKLAAPTNAARDEVLHLAESLLQQGKVAEAHQLVTRLRQSEPDFPPALHLHGRLALQNGQPREAAELFLRACEADPQSSIYRESHALAAVVQGKLKLAEQSFLMALKLGPTSTNLWFQQGSVSFRQGQLAVAQLCFELALRANVANADAWNALGATMRAQGQLPRAIECYQTALAHRSDYPDALNNLGIALEKSGRLDEAEQSLRKALRLRPDLAAAHNSLGNVLIQRNQFQEANDCFRQALEISPSMVAARNNLGLCLKRQGNLAGAIASFEAATTQQPNFVQAWTNLGNALRATGELSRAIECFHQALEINPRSADAHCNLAHARLDQSEFSAAEECYRTALQLDPAHAETFFGLANLLREQGEPEKALQHYEAAIRRQPDHLGAINNLGNTLRQLDRLDEAIETYQQAVDVSPDFLEGHNNLGNAYRQQQRFEEAASCYRHVLDRQGHEPLQELRLATLFPTIFDDNHEMDQRRREMIETWEQFAGRGSYADFTSLMMAANEPPFNLQFLAENIRCYKEAYANIFSVTNQPKVSSTLRSRPKIGFVVTRQHEVAFVKSLWGVLKGLCTYDVDVVIVCSQVSNKRFLQVAADLPIDVLPLPDRISQVVPTLERAAFDILYYWEVGTDSLNYFLPFMRLAPIQCTSWGIQVTTGIPNMDYYLSSDLVEPADALSHYSETLLCGPSLLTHRYLSESPPVTKTRTDYNLPEQANIYLCAQQLGKFHTDFDNTLRAILENDGQGQVVITSDRYGHVASQLEKRLQRSLGECFDRLRIIPRQAEADYLNLIRIADVLLDPPHFSGVNSSYDAFSQNKFIVTQPGAFHRGRYTAACYQKMNMSDCVALSADQTIELALKLGRNPDIRAEHEQRIADNRHLLFEDKQAIQDHFDLIQQMLNQ